MRRRRFLAGSGYGLAALLGAASGDAARADGAAISFRERSPRTS